MLRDGSRSRTPSLEIAGMIGGGIHHVRSLMQPRFSTDADAKLRARDLHLARFRTRVEQTRNEKWKNKKHNIHVVDDDQKKRTCASQGSNRLLIAGTLDFREQLD